jgi:hypothetical protein
MELYLNCHLRAKEFEVIIQPTDNFLDLVDDTVPIYFLIYTKERYFQDFLVNENLKINLNEYESTLKKYINISEQYKKKLSEESIVMINEKRDFYITTFYINESFIDIDRIIQCCDLYSKKCKQESFSLFLYKNYPIYQNGKKNIESITNNPDNEKIEEYILYKNKMLVSLNERIELIILDKIISNEKALNPNYPKNVMDLFIPVQENEKHYVTNQQLLNQLRREAIRDLKLNEFLQKLYGNEKATYLLNLLNENPYKYWKY